MTTTTMTRRTRTFERASYSGALGDVARRVQEIAADPRARQVRELLLAQAWSELCPPGQCLGTSALGFWCLAADSNVCPRMVRGQTEQRSKALVDTQVPERALQAQWERVPETFRARLRDYCDAIRQHVATGRGVLMIGGPGCGKTSCLGIVARSAVEARSWCLYCSSGLKLADTIMAYHLRGQQEETYLLYRHTPLLLVDDLDRAFALAKGDGGSLAMSRLDVFFDERYAEGLATCVATNANLEQVKQQRELERTTDRWRECMWVLGTRETSQRVEPQPGGETCAGSQLASQQ